MLLIMPHPVVKQNYFRCQPSVLNLKTVKVIENDELRCRKNVLCLAIKVEIIKQGEILLIRQQREEKNIGKKFFMLRREFFLIFKFTSFGDKTKMAQLFTNLQAHKLIISFPNS